MRKEEKICTTDLQKCVIGICRFSRKRSAADLREGVAVEYVSCEPIPEVTYTPDISAEARKEYAERVITRHKEKAEQG